MAKLTLKELQDLHREYFRVASMRTGIPIEHYRLTDEIIAKAESAKELRLAHEKYCKEHGIEITESLPQFPGILAPRYSRRSTGDFSIKEEE